MAATFSIHDVSSVQVTEEPAHYSGFTTGIAIKFKNGDYTDIDLYSKEKLGIARSDDSRKMLDALNKIFDLADCPQGDELSDVINAIRTIAEDTVFDIEGVVP